MKRDRFTRSASLRFWGEHEVGARTADLARKHGIFGATIYTWKAKYGGLEVSETKWLRTLDDKNRRLKLAETVRRSDIGHGDRLTSNRGDVAPLA